MSSSLFTVRLSAYPEVLMTDGGENLLMLLKQKGLTYRNSCRNGVCQICEIELLSGELFQRYPEQYFSVKKGETAVKILGCTAYARSDLELRVPGLKSVGEREVTNRVCSVQHIEKLNRDVYRVMLQLPATASLAVSYQAGQYLDLVLPEGESASFSIASAPEKGRELELHIRVLDDSPMSLKVIEHLQSSSSVEVRLPMGNCCLDLNALQPEQPVLLVAASTGFSQVKSMVEHLLLQNVSHPIHIYWGGRSADDLYLADLINSWNDNPLITAHLAVSEPDSSPLWQGRVGLLTAVLAEDFPQFEGAHTVICGSPPMVYAVVDQLEASGMSINDMQSDVFAYAPRG